MSTSVKELGVWFDQGVAKGATHMIVVCDTYDWEDFPLYVMPGEDARAKRDANHGTNMQRVMEVYNLSMDREEQLKAGTRVFNY